MGKKSTRRFSVCEHIFGKFNTLKILECLHRDNRGRAVYKVKNLTTNEIYYGLRNRDITRIANSNKDPLVFSIDGDSHTLVEWNNLLGLSNHTLQEYYKRHEKDRKAVEDHIKDLLSNKNENEREEKD